MAARERLEDNKIFTHLLGWRCRRSSRRRLQRKAHINTAWDSPSARIWWNSCGRLLFFCFVLFFNENRSSRNQLPGSAGGRPFTSVLLFDNRGAFLKSCTSENNKNKRTERETHAKLITDCCPCKRVRPQPPPPHHPRILCLLVPVTSVATQLLLCHSPTKRCSKTNHDVNIAVLPRERDDVNKLLWRERRTSGNRSAFCVRCVYCNPGLASRSLSAPVVLPGFDACARLQRAGSLEVTRSVCFTGNVDWWLLGAHWSSQWIFTWLGLSWR